MQTVAGAWWKVGPPLVTETARYTLTLPDGDRLVLHDDTPADWAAEDRAAILVHGLGGCYLSRYMQRITRNLTAAGVRTFRLDLRGCGAGRNQACQPYHAGRIEDLQAAYDQVRDLCRQASIGVAGFSLGGNLVLRWLGETANPAGLDLALAVNPPVDLAAATQAISRAARGAYDRHFARLLYRQVRHSTQWSPVSPLATLRRWPRTVIEFDELFTAPLCGFEDAAHYYRTASAAAVVHHIQTPTLILSAEDDPLIPVDTLRALALSDAATLHLQRNGGHLGYIAGQTNDPDRHWMDWRVVEWLTGQW